MPFGFSCLDLFTFLLKEIHTKPKQKQTIAEFVFRIGTFLLGSVGLSEKKTLFRPMSIWYETIHALSKNNMTS